MSNYCLCEIVAGRKTIDDVYARILIVDKLSALFREAAEYIEKHNPGRSALEVIQEERDKLREEIEAMLERRKRR